MENAITMNIVIIVHMTELFVRLLSEGVTAIAITKLKNIPLVLSKPQLIDSVTPSSTVYSTANS